MAGEVDALRDRWTPGLVQQVEEAFARYDVPSVFPPVVADGVEYRDLRGLPIRKPVREIPFDHVDFSHARMEEVGAFLEVMARDCLFVEAALDGNLRGHFLRCRFDGGTLAEASILGGSTLRHCSFAHANLRMAKGAGLVFERCDFSGANLKGAHLTQSEFHRCTWEGTRFLRSSLGHSKITRAGFPAEKGAQSPDALLPEVILDHVTWLE
jgi:hypothetical protein